MEPELFLQYLQTEMQARGWTQKEMSRAIGVSEPQLSRWRSGQHKPSQLTIESVVRTLSKLAKPGQAGALTMVAEDEGPGYGDALEDVLVDLKNVRREIDLLIVRIGKINKHA